jgi:hypothetical protein
MGDRPEDKAEARMVEKLKTLVGWLAIVFLAYNLLRMMATANGGIA